LEEPGKGILTMSVQSYKEARKLIEAAGGGDFEGNKPESLVARAEFALGLAFPPSYRFFLSEMGAGDFNGFEVFGLINDNFSNSSVPNGVWLTLSERRAIGLHPAYIIVGEAGDGTYFALDTRPVGRTCEAPVVRLSVDAKNHERVAESFGDYLLERVNCSIASGKD
jgi:hypothetical protein